VPEADSLISVEFRGGQLRHATYDNLLLSLSRTAKASKGATGFDNGYN